MQTFWLSVGLLLPWWAGFAIVSRFEPGGHAARRMRQVGTGYLVGCALLYLLLRLDSALTGGVDWNHVALALAVIGLAAYVLKRAPEARPADVLAPVFGPLQRALVLVLSGWLLLHLWFNWIEVLATPVYPWDAWAVWVYRAKAWFAHANLFEFLTPEQWLQEDAVTSYSTTALQYPWFVSILPFWAALSLGSWHETLVGLPVALLGVAIAMAFYGQLRSHGLQPLAALVFTYFLLSTPLLGVHLSLAGYADIWLAGFAGLGSIALLRYLLEGNVRQLVIGLVLLACGALVKIEGLVWLLAALLLLALCRIPLRWLVGIAAAVLLAGLVAWLTGVGSVELPGLGLIGVRDGALHLPYLGSHELVVFDQRWVYFNNAFIRASWHLAWLFALAIVVFSVVRGRRLRPVLTFLLIVAGVQVAIFVFSSQGAWAEDSTAINRLPLQIYPAVMFAIAAGWHSLVDAGAERPRVLAVAGVMLGSGLLVVALALWWVQRVQAEAATQPLQLAADNLSFVAGNGAAEANGDLRVDGFSDGIALLSTGPMRIDAAELYLLQLELDYDWSLPWPDAAPAFFWRRAEDPELVSRLTLSDAGIFDLTDSEDWHGEIIEVGFLVLENQGQVATLRSARLSGPDTGALGAIMPTEWFSFEPWTQRSANVIFGGVDHQHVSMTLLVSLWMVLAMSLAALLAHRQGRDLATSLLLVALLGWMSLDARWTSNRWQQSGLSWNLMRTQDLETRMASGETGMYHDWIRHLESAYLGTQPRRILLIPDRRLDHYYAYRSRYVLLPHSVTVAQELPPVEQLRDIDYVLYLGDFMQVQASAKARNNKGLRLRNLDIPDATRRWLKPVEINPQGALLKVRPPKKPRA